MGMGGFGLERKLLEMMQIQNLGLKYSKLID